MLTDIVLISPLESHLEVMVLEDSVIELLQEFIRLVGTKFIDLLREWAHGVDALPAGHWVGPDNGVDCGQIGTSVQRATSRLSVHLDVGIHLSSLEEAGTNVSCRETLKELLVGR